MSKKLAITLFSFLLLSAAIQAQDFMGEWQPDAIPNQLGTNFTKDSDGNHWAAGVNNSGQIVFSQISDDITTLQTFTFDNTPTGGQGAAPSVELPNGDFILYSVSNQENRILRFSPSTGAVVWSKQYSHPNLRNLSLYRAKDGVSFYLSGWLWGDDYYFAQIDAATGDVSTEHVYGTGADDQFYVAGETSTGNLLLGGASSAVGWEGVIAEVDWADGTVIRSKRIESLPSHQFHIMGATELPDGSLLVSGNHRSFSGYDKKGVLAKLSSDWSTLLWIKEYDYSIPGYDIAASSHYVADGHIYWIFNGSESPNLGRGLFKLDMDGNLLDAMTGVIAYTNYAPGGKVKTYDSNTLQPMTGLWSPAKVFDSPENGGPCWNPTQWAASDFVVNDLASATIADWALVHNASTAFTAADLNISATASTDYNFTPLCVSSGISGNVFQDADADCAVGASEVGIAGVMGIIEPGGIVVQTNVLGNWYIPSLPDGDYTITYDVPDFWMNTCPVSQNFSVAGSDDWVQTSPYGLQSEIACTSPDVSIHMPLIRPCRENQTVYVSACNAFNGTDVLTDPTIIVHLDTRLSPTAALYPYTDLGGGMYQFDLTGTSLLPGACAQFWISVDASCELSLGETVCMEAHLQPFAECALDNEPNGTPIPCTEPWDNSSLSVEGYCQDGTIYFEVTNTGDPGDGDMVCFSQIRVYIDGELVIVDSIQLVGGETIVFEYEGTGGTWHFETDQHPLHPGNSQPNANIEGCGDGEWTPGLVNIFPMDDADPVVDIYCGTVTASYDPNDKRGFPLGVTENNYIAPNQQMEYKIRFQNTGTDTAFLVVVRDTLPEELDIFSVLSGVSSHPYEFQIYGPRVLEWTFHDIMLPDSTTNEEGSHGFVNFTVNQVPDLPEGTSIDNHVGIYFDFNEPVLTNVAHHEIYYGLQDFVSSTSEVPGLPAVFKLYPNPSTGDLYLELDQAHAGAEVSVVNAMGQVVSQQTTSHEQIIPLRIHAGAGVYLVRIRLADGYTETHKVTVFGDGR